MSNTYGLPETDLAFVRERDANCVYCRKNMAPSGSDAWRGDWATIEHLNHLPPWDNPKTIAICCSSCNSSRGNKLITKWFDSAFCRERNISLATVAKPVRDYVKEYET